MLLYTALIGYLWQEALEEDRNFATLIDMIGSMQTREDNEDFRNPIDLMFEDLEREKPDCFAVRQYKKFKLAAGKTAKSILISCGARLAVFDIAELRELTAYDEMELDTLGDQKTALFLIMSDTDDSFNFLIAMCYTQLFNLLCDKADDVYGGALARACALSDRRVRQYRADSETRKADGDDSQPRNLRMSDFADAEPAQGIVQGQCGNRHRQL